MHPRVAVVAGFVAPVALLAVFGNAGAAGSSAPLTAAAGLWGLSTTTEIGTYWAGPVDASALAVPEPRIPDNFAGPRAEELLKAAEDAFVSNGRGGDNFGDDSRLLIGDAPGFGATRSFIFWNLKDDLDRRFVVTGGTLRLHQRGGGPANDPGRDIPVSRVTGAWAEDDVTWDDMPSVDGGRIDTINMGTSSEWREWDIETAAKRWFDGRWDNHGVMVQGFEAGGSYREFDSSESSDEPELVLDGVLDTVAPVSRVLPLPEFTAVNPFPITWEGVDPDPASGIDYFVVWARRGTEAWTVVDPQSRGTSALFQGDSGKRYGFRVHGVDRAGNQEVPGPDAQATTLLDTNAPVTSLTALPGFSRGPQVTLNWTAVEFPQGQGIENSGIAHYDIQWSIGGGNFADLALGQQATSFAVSVDNGQTYAFRVRAVDRAGNVEPWGSAQTQTKVDSAAPRVWFLPTSGVDMPEFTVTWASTDLGGSGLANYDIQFRVADGPWQDWVSATTDTSRTFAGEYGNQYGFRARARDMVGNVGTYPAGAQLTVQVIAGADLTQAIFLPTLQGSTDPGQAPSR